MFHPKTYILRREDLKKKIDTGVLAVSGQRRESHELPENGYHFRQDSSFLYYFGLDFPGLAALIDIDENREIIFGNELTIDDIVWMGTQPTLAEKGRSVGIEITAPVSDLSVYLRKAAAPAGRPVHFLPPLPGRQQDPALDSSGYPPGGSGRQGFGGDDPGRGQPALL
jgi:Xaa-Pro aminopeptidase